MAGAVDLFASEAAAPAIGIEHAQPHRLGAVGQRALDPRDDLDERRRGDVEHVGRAGHASTLRRPGRDRQRSGAGAAGRPGATRPTATWVTPAARFWPAPGRDLWHPRQVTARTLLAAFVAAAVGLSSAGSASAQLWKPKKKPAATSVAAKKKRPATTARKRPTRKKPASAVVRFEAPRDRDDDDDRPSDRDDAVAFDDSPRITVVDGDRDE